MTFPFGKPYLQGQAVSFREGIRLLIKTHHVKGVFFVPYIPHWRVTGFKEGNLRHPFARFQGNYRYIYINIYTYCKLAKREIVGEVPQIWDVWTKALCFG